MRPGLWVHLCDKLCGDLLSLSPTPQPVSSSDSEAAEADRAGGSEDDEDRGVMAVTAVTAAATGDRMESDSDSDKSSDNSGLKRKAVALKVGTGHACPVGAGPFLFLRGPIWPPTLPPRPFLLVVFSTFTELWQRHLCQFQNFPSPPKESPSPLAVPHVPTHSP